MEYWAEGWFWKSRGRGVAWKEGEKVRKRMNFEHWDEKLSRTLQNTEVLEELCGLGSIWEGHGQIMF